MKVLVTFAVEAEFAPWRKRRGDWVVKDAVVHAYEFSARDLHVCVILTGIGCQRAWDVNAASLWGSDFDVCISAGLAGSLRSEYRPGDVLVAQGIRDCKKQQTLECDRALTELAAQSGARRVNAFYTSPRIVVTAGEKRALRELGEAVEMEGRRVVGTAGHGLGWRARCVAIRAISDSAEEDLPLDFNRFLSHSGDVDIRKIMKELLRRPWILGGLIGFGRRSRAAAKRLACFLDEFVQTLGTAGKAVIGEKAAAR